MTTKNAHDLILRIAQAFVAYPDKLTLEMRGGEEALHFVLQGDPRDDPRLIGGFGSHAAAMRFLVTQMGRADQQRYTFQVLNSTEPRERIEQPQVKADHYYPGAEANLLTEILCQLDIGEFMVKTEPAKGATETPTFTLNIELPNPTDVAALIAQRKFKHGEGETLSIVNALSTLFRAISKVQGVKLKIAVIETT